MAPKRVTKEEWKALCDEKQKPFDTIKELERQLKTSYHIIALLNEKIERLHEELKSYPELVELYNDLFRNPFKINLVD